MRKGVKRPSTSIKSPYVADVLLDDGRRVIAHSAALGCCGLSDNGARIWLQPMSAKKTTDAKCSHRICLSTMYDTVREKSVTIGIFPKYAEELAEKALVGNYLRCLQGVRKYRRETVIKVDGFVGKDLMNMTQQKIIQAMGRIGRNNIQQDYSVRFRDDGMISNLFMPPEKNVEAEIMSKLFNS